MKKFVTGVVLSALLAVLAVPCFALDTFTDSFHAPADGDAVQYGGSYRMEQGLFADIGWNCPDKDGLLLAQNNSSACATYRISGANHVNFTFYTPFAPFAAPDSAYPQQYSIGYEHSSAVSGESFQVSSAQRLYYQENTQEIFFSDNGKWYRVIYHQTDYCYRAQEVPKPSGTLTSLFCNLYASSDGVHFAKIDYQITNVHCAVQDGAAMAFCYQSAGASLPADTSYVQLRLTGCGQVPDETGNRIPYDRTAGIALAEVCFTGSDLVIGTPREESPDSSVSSAASSDSSKKEPSSQKESSSSKLVSSKNSSGKDAVGRQSSSKTARAKYDGTGVAEPENKGVFSTLEQNQERAEPDSHENASLIETQVWSSERDQALRYGYIYLSGFLAVLFGVLLFMLYRKKHPQKQDAPENPKTPSSKA